MSYSLEAKGIYTKNLQSNIREVREESTNTKFKKFSFIAQA